MASAESVAVAKIEAEKKFLSTVGHEIWKHPELCYKEIKAHALLTDALEKYGFSVQRHYVVDTAFRAEYGSKGGNGPTIAVLCEYDALPEIGHACGHNLIAEAGVAAGVALKSALEADTSLKGKVVVLGTPAEEGGGGKIRLIKEGAFKDVDIAMMVHPAKIDQAFGMTLCFVKLSVTYKGKEAHASVYPWEGRNALDAAVACYSNIAMLRQHIKPMCRVHGIIVKGGTAANVIPSETQLEFYVRAPSVAELKSLEKRVENCITSAAVATGCDVSYEFDHKNGYSNIITNKILGDLYVKYAESFGVKFEDGDPKLLKTAGSTDMGNVSHVVPSIHPFYSVGGTATNHTRGFTEDVGADKAQEPTLIASKAMALAALEVLKKPEMVEEIKSLFRKEVAGVKFQDGDPKLPKTAASTDMGNVSHVVPSVHPRYSIRGTASNHTKGFSDDAGDDKAQEPTLTAAKSMTLVALEILRKPEMVDEIKSLFRKDIASETS